MPIALSPATEGHLGSGSSSTWGSLTALNSGGPFRTTCGYQIRSHFISYVGLAYAVSDSVFFLFCMWKHIHILYMCKNVSCLRPREVTSFAGKSQGLNPGLLFCSTWAVEK